MISESGMLIGLGEVAPLPESLCMLHRPLKVPTWLWWCACLREMEGRDEGGGRELAKK